MAIQHENWVYQDKSELLQTASPLEIAPAISKEELTLGIKIDLTDDQLYNTGVTDYVYGRRHTEAAKHFINYWSEQE